MSFLGFLAFLVVMGIIALVAKVYEHLDKQKRRHENELMMKQWEKRNKHD